MTICTKDRLCLFGKINDGEMILNDAGIIAEECWKDIPVHFPNVLLDEWVIMPNHIHGIIIITVGANDNSPENAKDNSPEPVKDNSPEPVKDNSPEPVKNISPEQQGNVGAKNFSPLRESNQILSKSETVDAKNILPLRSYGTSKTIGSIIRGFKIGVTKWMRQNEVIYHVWQRNYYEHIIRNEKDLRIIREYIVNNPLKWQYDKENPNCIKNIYL